MAVSYVKIPTDVYFVCVNHALSTEGEEIVGLLVGQVENRVVDISAVILLRRSDKRKDRVEISPEQLSNASTEAEHMSIILKKTVRVIGWYHSHPKLTVWPSAIDVNTQDNYQLMEESFIGLIFSVFNEDPNKKGGRIMMTCYQSQNVMEGNNIEKKRLDIPIHIIPSNYISAINMNALIQLPSLLCQEEQLAYQAVRDMNLDFLTTLHNSSVYIRSMGQIAEVICGPLIKMMEERIINNEMKRKQLQALKKEKLALLEQLKIEVAELKLAAEANTDIAVKNVALDTGRVSTASANKAVESFPTLSSSSEEISTVVSSLESSASSATIVDYPQPSDDLELAAMMDSESFMKDRSNLPAPSHSLSQSSCNAPGRSHTESETGKSDVQLPVPSADQGKDIDFQLESPPESPESNP